MFELDQGLTPVSARNENGAEAPPAHGSDVARTAAPPLKRLGSFSGTNVDHPPAAPAVSELDHARDLREQRIVLAAAHVVARLKARAALTNQDRPAADKLAREAFDSQPLGVRVSAVS